MIGRLILGAVGGAVLGLLLYTFVGCRTGACPLTANPWVAAALWGALGAVLMSPK